MGKITDRLEEALKKTNPNKLDEFFENNWSDMLDGEREFTVFMRNTVKRKQLRWKDIYNAAGISEDYGQEVIGMRKPAKSRDLIIRLCLGGKFNLEDTQHALTLYGMQPLYARIPRDAVLITAISHGKYDLIDIDEMMAGQGFEIISKEIK